MTTLTYGNGVSCRLDAERIVHLQPTCDTVLSYGELVSQVRTVLGEPIDYPPLAQATVPGDRVVLALAEGLPQPMAMVEGALAALQDAGVESSLVTVLLPNEASYFELLKNKLQDWNAVDCEVALHDPDDETHIAMFGVTKHGQALRLNRTLCDADLVLSLGVAAADNGASFNGLYPGFSDRETINRLDAPLSEAEEELEQQHREEITDAGWMLGVGMIVQVVPGADGNVAEVLAGEAKEVLKTSAEKFREAWKCADPEPADLVIATLVGNAEQQTWANLGHALQSAEVLRDEGGTICVCSEIAQLPGQAFESLAGNEDYQLAEREILRDRVAGSAAALRVCRALDRGPVYLCSELPAGVVESLGFTPIASDDELERLVEAHERVTVLAEAQRSLPTISDQ